MPNTGTVSDIYRERSSRFRRERERLQRKLRWLTRGRLATFLAAAAMFVEGGARHEPRWALIAVGFAFIVTFVILVAVHRSVNRLVRYHGELQRVSDEALARLERRWDGLGDPPAGAAQQDHPYAADLDVCGPASLFQLVCTAATPLGRAVLRNWLLQPADPDAVIARQSAVSELTPQIDLRDELVVRGRLIGTVRREVVDRFASWSRAGRWILDRPWLVAIAWLLPLSSVFLAVLQATGVIPYYLWAFTLLGCVIVWRITDGAVEGSFNAASSGETALRQFSGLFGIVAAAPFSSARLVQVQRTLDGDGNAACRQMRRLDRILACAEVRFSDFLHALVQAATLWDLHVLAALERWREENGEYVAGWFDAFGELEAFASLASLAHAHPGWAFPEFQADGSRTLEASDLGHPLLPPNQCVVNDLRLGPPGKFMLLTGSNMSGKSTLLRAIGVNVVLAHAGAPVCASRMSLPRTRVFTAMHVHDSLTEGVSQFMAALNRLKLVVDAARDAATESVAFLYLLDEILQGTNAAERQTAVRKIVRHMLQMGAIGAISTHDLTLAETRDLAPAAEPVHFSETIEQSATGPKLSFDYKLRPGIATSTNALRLMEIVGL